MTPFEIPHVASSPMLTQASRTPDSMVEQLRQLAMPRLEVACLETLGKADDALFDLAQNARTNESQKHYFDAMREIRREHGSMEQLFRNYLNARFSELRRFGSTQGSDPAAIELSSLSLMAQEELEEQLAIEQTANVVQRRYKLVLEQVTRGFTKLATASGRESVRCPISPESLAAAFHSAVSGVVAHAEVKLVLFKLYERQLMQALETVYPEALRALVDGGYASNQIVRVPPMPMPQPARLGSVGHSLVDGNSVPHREPASMQHAQMPGVQNISEGYATSQYGGPQPQYAGAYPQYAGGEIDENALSGLHELLQAWRRLQYGESFIPQQAAPPTTPPLSSREMMSVLSLFQADLPDGVKTALESNVHSLAQQLKRELITGAAALGISGSDAHLGPTEEDAIDLVGMMFEVFLDERDMESRSREVIARLLVPYVKVALLDRRLFLHKAHPARRLLNAIAEACEGNHGEGPHERELLQRVDDSVERLIREFNEDLAIFELLEQELRAFIDQYRRRAELAARRVVEAQRGKERLEEARQRAETLLADRFAQGQAISPLVQEDLRHYWVHHYSVIYLREGEDSNSVIEAVSTLDRMLGLADVAFHTGGLTGAAETESLQPGLLAMLASSGLTGDSAVECARVMAQHLMQPAAAEPAVMPEIEVPAAVERVADNVVALRTGNEDIIAPSAVESTVAASQLSETVTTSEVAELHVVGGTATLDFEPADVERVRQLQIGNWVEFFDDAGRVQPAKLSWVSPISSRLLFVNRRGARVQVASFEELAAMMKAGTLKLRDADTAFDQAMHQVLGRLRESTREAG
jgi:hypothetical protein